MHYYLVDGTLTPVNRWSPVSPTITEETSEMERGLQRHWAMNFWATPLFDAFESLSMPEEELKSLLTEHLPYIESGLISILDRSKMRRSKYRPGKAAKVLFPGCSELFAKKFAESLIKPTATSLELTEGFRAAYLAVKSCMSKTETTLQAVELYKAIPGLTCLIIKSEKGAIVGRAICNPIKKVYLELYLHPLLDDGDVSHLLEGWSWDNNFLIGEKLPLIRTPNGILCPYLDTDSGMVRIMEDHLLITSDYGSGFATTIHGLIVG